MDLLPGLGAQEAARPEEPASAAARPAVAKRRPANRDAATAAELPVARVAAMVPFAHLDRPFDYLVPASMAADAVPGARVRVRFAGRLVDGFVLERVDQSEHAGRLAPLAKAISPEPVLSRPVARLARAVADRYAGTLADVLRLAIPPRHATAEKAEKAEKTEQEARPGDPAPPADPGEWRRYPAGPSLLAALAAGRSPRAVWWAPPGPGWPAMVAAAVRATLSGGRGALVVVPDHRDVDRVADALSADLGPAAELVVSLRADLGPAERYRRFLAARRGRARVVVGTRAAVFAPVESLGLVVVWDDGDDLHAEPRAPYPHTRDVAVLRSRLEESALLVGGHAPSTDAEALTRSGWAHPLVLPRREARQLAPLVWPTGSDWEAARDEAARSARLPSLAVRAAREALAADRPVLVQVPRRGYQPSLACASCRRPARCPHCHGPLGRPGGGRAPACRWCGRPAADWACPGCADPGLRVSVTGDRRTAEELGRAFPGVTLRTSGRDEVLATVPAGPALVVATPGAEPVADGGYGAVLLLDGWALLGRPDLRTGEETLRRWANAAALAVAGPAGGRVVVVADEGLGPVQALVRWDPAGFVAREADDRAELGFPPATRIAAVEGTTPILRAFLEAATLPAAADVLGPVPLPAPARRSASAAPPAAAAPAGPGAGGVSAVPGADGADGPRERLLVRVPRKQGGELAEALRAARGVLDARRAAAGLRVQLDPISLG
ncbi:MULTISPECIES: primosomal protein N' [Pseudofrankia]|uniref:primosomal protein N' n=1 Tax=Pseudofrankia TaxID=2994363 RepID=UPI0009F3FC0F|nr:MULTISPECIES: primosomal protein N' [Pseudofrankia]